MFVGIIISQAPQKGKAGGDFFSTERDAKKADANRKRIPAKAGAGEKRFCVEILHGLAIAARLC
jgi:hypothetical protein